MTDAATASSRTMKGRNMVVVFFSRAGENYEVGEVTVGNTAKLAQEVARRQRAWTDSGTYHRNHQDDGEAGACGHGDRRTEQRK